MSRPRKTARERMSEWVLHSVAASSSICALLDQIRSLLATVSCLQAWHAITCAGGAKGRSGGVLVLVNDTGIGRLFFRIRHVRKIERLASFRQRDPRITQAFIMFALLGGSSSSCASVAHLAAVSHAAWLLLRMWCFSIFSTSRAMVAPGLHCASHSFHDAATIQDGGGPLAASISEQPPQPRLSNAVYRWVWRPV
jgi:hypothetical protein